MYFSKWVIRIIMFIASFDVEIEIGRKTDPRTPRRLLWAIKCLREKQPPSVPSLGSLLPSVPPHVIGWKMARHLVSPGICTLGPPDMKGVCVVWACGVCSVHMIHACVACVVCVGGYVLHWKGLGKSKADGLRLCQISPGQALFIGISTMVKTYTNTQSLEKQISQERGKKKPSWDWISQ